MDELKTGRRDKLTDPAMDSQVKATKCGRGCGDEVRLRPEFRREGSGEGKKMLLLKPRSLPMLRRSVDGQGSGLVESGYCRVVGTNQPDARLAGAWRAWPESLWNNSCRGHGKSMAQSDTHTPVVSIDGMHKRCLFLFLLVFMFLLCPKVTVFSRNRTSSITQAPPKKISMSKFCGTADEAINIFDWQGGGVFGTATKYPDQTISRAHLDKSCFFHTLAYPSRQAASLTLCDSTDY